METVLFLVQVLIGATDVEVQQSAWSALDAVAKAIKKENLTAFVSVLRDSLQSLTEELKRAKRPLLVPGFCLPKVLYLTSCARVPFFFFFGPYRATRLWAPLRASVLCCPCFCRVSCLACPNFAKLQL
jgi:hypothetical protein